MGSGARRDGLSVTPFEGGWAACGELDANTAPTLTEALANARPDIEGVTVVLDLADVDFIDSSGLSALLDAHLLAEKASGVLVLRNPSRAVSRLLEMTRLADVFHVDGVAVSAPSDLAAE